MNFMFTKRGVGIVEIILILTLVGTITAITFQQNVTVNIVPGTMDVFSPLEGVIYDTRMIPINISLSDHAIFRYAKFIDGNGSLVTLCRNCNSYGFDNVKLKPFDDGFHQLRIVAIFDGGEVEEIVAFFVDSKAPRIKKTAPQGGFANGTFEIDFVEENVRSLVLSYGNSQVGFRQKNISASACKNTFFGVKHCTTSVDLSDFEGSDIMYSFMIEDIAGQIAVSRNEHVGVDFTHPVVDLIHIMINGRRVSFELAVTEQHLKDVLYKDLFSSFSFFRQLCSPHSNGSCENVIPFTRGHHELMVVVSDEAGHTTEEFVEFDV